MSVWTHVAGLIRYDDVRALGLGLKAKYIEALGRTSSFEEPRSDCNMPCGSEGSLQWWLTENPDASHLAAYIVSIWGDLRDYDDLDAIGKWFRRCVEPNTFLVRQAVLHAEVESGQGRVWYWRDRAIVETSHEAST